MRLRICVKFIEIAMIRIISVQLDSYTQTHSHLNSKLCVEWNAIQHKNWGASDGHLND